MRDRKTSFERLVLWCALIALFALIQLAPTSSYAQETNEKPANLKNVEPPATSVTDASIPVELATAKPAAGKPKPAPPPGVSYDWSGFYAGGHIGWGAGEGNTSITPLPTATQFINLQPTTLRPDPDGIIGGGQVGYNWQCGVWVFGGEFSFSLSRMDGTQTVTPIIQNNGTPFPGAGFLRAHQDTDWFGTLRPRIGITPTQRALVYVTGGFAFARVNYAAETDFRPVGTVHYPAAFSKTKNGYTLGLGGEFFLNHRVSIKGEYLYYDLGDETVTANPSLTLPPFQVRYAWSTKAQTLNGGINFHF